MSRSTGSFPPNTDQLRQSKHKDTQTANMICSQSDTSPFFLVESCHAGVWVRGGAAQIGTEGWRRGTKATPKPLQSLQNPVSNDLQRRRGGGAAATKNAIRALRNQHAGLQPPPVFKPQSDPNPIPTSLSPHSFLPNTSLLHFTACLFTCGHVYLFSVFRSLLSVPIGCGKS